MPLPPRMRRVIAAALLVITTFGAGYVLQARWRPAGPVVALVDGVPVRGDEVDVRLSDILPFASYHGRIEGERMLALRRAALDLVVLDTLVYQEALEAGLKPDEAAVDAAVAEVIGRFPSRAEFERALADARLTERDVRERHERADVVRAARRAHQPRPVTESDVVAYYGANAAKFERPEQRRLVELLVRIDPADPASIQRAEHKAKALAARATRGEDLGNLARGFSEDEYRVKDGDMGFVHRGRLDEELDAAVFAAPVGRVSVAREFRGFTVFKVLAAESPRRLTLDEARPIIRERLTRQRAESAAAAWRAALLKSARIEILEPGLRAARPAELPPAAMEPALGGGSQDGSVE
jgi:parvulin-like peptidyl-prolyl isomerase